MTLILAFDIKDYNLPVDKVDDFLSHLASIIGPHTQNKFSWIDRKPPIKGISATLLTSVGQVSVHTFNSRIAIHVVGFIPLSQHNLIDGISSFCPIRLDQITIHRIEPTSKVECEESGCIRKATRDYNGLKVCQDHYEYHKQRMREELDKMNEW